MPYTTAASVKSYLDITAASYDTILGTLVADADVEINSALDIDGFLTDTPATELIQRKDVSIYGRYGYYSFLLKNFNVLVITHLNGTVYTGTKTLTGDYYVKHWRQVIIKNLDTLTYQSVDNFWFFEVTYTYGYDTIPADIALLAKLRVVVKFRKQYPNYTQGSTGDASMAGISEYQLADEKVKFITPDMTNQIATDEGQIERILAKYRKPHVIS